MTDTTTAPRVELLAPAGGHDSLRAAVRNGADAVYLGVADFNARRGAENFALDTLADACRYAHLRGTKVYLTANVVILEHEMTAALRMIARAWEAGIDAIIVQDLGLLRAVRSALPEVRLHASTQIDVHNHASVSALAVLGVSRVTLARELEVGEIADLAGRSPVELESFVHGSLCFCHSGQCFMSSMMGGRSANRGLCAQPCRLPYDLVNENGAVVEVPGRYLLSPKDLAGIELLPQLVASGVTALKIEGRMKSPEYVAAVVSVYRDALDRVLRDPEHFSVFPAESERLEEAFSRGFTPGYLAGITDDRMMSYARPNNRGVLVGRVAEMGQGRASLVLDRSLESGDVIEFWTASGRFSQPVGEMALRNGVANAAPEGERVSIVVEKPVRAADRVFRVVNAALTEAARRSWQSTEERRPIPADVHVKLRSGKPIEIGVEADGHVVTVTGPVVEAARTKAVTAQEVIDHVGRFGGTPYGVGRMGVDLDADVGVGFSLLHRLRREALERLDDKRLLPWAGRRMPSDPSPPPVPGGAVRKRTTRPELVVAVADQATARACRASGADRVLLMNGDCATGTSCTPLLPRVAHDRTFDELLERAGSAEARSAVVAGNLGLVAAVGGAARSVEADWGLNVVNPWAADALAGLGATLVWASPELSGRQLATLVDGSSVPVGVVVGGRLELMVAEHCVLQAVGPCAHDCSRCARRLKRWGLRDRKGYEMPVTTDASGMAHIYNAVPLDLSRALPEILETGVSAVRLELQASSADDAAEVTRAWRGRLDTAWAGGRLPDRPILEPSTAAHFFRGLR